MENPESAAEELCREALALPREQRSAFLEGACRGAPDLRRRVESLLSANNQMSEFASSSAGISADQPTAPLPKLNSHLPPGTKPGRSLDYLDTRSDIDHGKTGYLGVSMGSADGVIITAMLRERLKTAIFLDGGYFLEKPPPGGDQADFAPRIKIPVLMVNGRYDYTFPVEKAQNLLFQMLGTPADQKSHIVLDTPHDVTEQRPRLVKAVLDWLDHYLGRVE